MEMERLSSACIVSSPSRSSQLAFRCTLLARKVLGARGCKSILEEPRREVDNEQINSTKLTSLVKLSNAQAIEAVQRLGEVHVCEWKRFLSVNIAQV